MGVLTEQEIAVCIGFVTAAIPDLKAGKL